MAKRELLSPSHDTASRAIVDVQTATTHVKALITECVSKGISDEELTKRLNKAIAEECKHIKDVGFREQLRKALVTSARKWHYELSQTYRINEANFRRAVAHQPFNIELSDLLDKTPYQKQFEFRKLLDDGTNPGIPVIKDYQSSVKLAMKALSAEPPKIVTTKNGRTYVMPARLRAEMAVRYAAAVENLQRLINEGVLFCWISSHPNCSPRCSSYQGKLYSLFQGKVMIDGKEYGERGVIDGISYRPINEALAGPNGDGNGCISGYNCRHRAIEYERGSRPPEDFSKAQMQREYAIDKQQRNYENRIRQLKQEERQLRACGMDKEASAVRKKWRRLTKDYQIYSVENNRAYYPYRYVIDRTETNGLTESASDVIITNENIKRSLGEKVITLQEAINNADPLVANAIARYQNQLSIKDANFKTTEKDSAHFTPGEGIYFDVEEDSLPSDEFRTQYQTYFHETGHNLDYAIGKKISWLGGYASERYKSPNYVEERLHYDKKGNVIGRTLNNLSFDDMIKKEGIAFIDAYRQLVEARTKKKASKREVYEEIKNDFKGEPLVNIRQLSDILDGITNGEMYRMGFGLGASHTYKNPNYWKTHSVGSESFAHFMSILSTNKQMVERYRAYFPKSFEIFEEILKL